jgi:hypothetical protein
MSFYLLDNPNPTGPNFRTYRRDSIRLIVLHTAEVLPDYDPPDTTAEWLAKYAATTTRDVSWHVSVDSDSTIYMLPDHYTAWHVRGYNDTGLGVEMCTQHFRWWQNPKYDLDLMKNTAQVCAKWALLHGIPVRKITAYEAQKGKKGFIGHSDLDPTRRKDPGPAFPWDIFLNLVRDYTDNMEWFWKLLVKTNLIQGDPAYYYSGNASDAEKDHAIEIAAQNFDKLLTLAELAEKLKE